MDEMICLHRFLERYSKYLYGIWIAMNLKEKVRCDKLFEKKATYVSCYY